MYIDTGLCDVDEYNLRTRVVLAPGGYRYTRTDTFLGVPRCL